jgi:hypothetical protein
MFPGAVFPGNALGLSAGGVFVNPTSIPGLFAWYRADLGITIGTGVSAWADQSGNGDANRNATQATGTKQPTLNASDAAFNNQSTISFSSAAVQLLATGTFSASLVQPATVYLVGIAGGAAVQIAIDGVGVTQMQIGCQVDGTSPRYFAGTGPVNGTGPMASKFAVGVVFNGASSAAYFNAISTATTSGNMGTNSLPHAQIGADSGGVGNWNGKIAELIYYAGSHNATQRGQVMNYLGARYAITITP